MVCTLPSTPAEVLDVKSSFLRSALSVVGTYARISGCWRHGYKNAATDTAEMGLADMCYWVHKCTHPVTGHLKGENLERLMNTTPPTSWLPKGFKKQQSLTIGAAGDILQAEGLELSKGILFENVADLLFGQDIAFANFESPITTQPLVKEIIGDQAPPTECCSRAQFNILKGHKKRHFDVLNTANNHAFDMGVEGLETTLRVLDEDDILEIGTNRTPEDALCGRILERKGIKVGFVASAFGLNGRKIPQEDAYRVNISRLLSKHDKPDLDSLKRQIDWCKSKKCDFIIASIHWGFEFEFFPRQRQVEAAHELVEYGADALFCHHPHVIQPVEYYRTQRDPGRIAVIAYSLGSLTWGFTAPHIVLSLLLNLGLAKGKLNGKSLTYIEETVVTPVFRSAVINTKGVETRIEKLVDHLHGCSTRHSREYIAKIAQYAQLVLGNSARESPPSVKNIKKRRTLKH